MGDLLEFSPYNQYGYLEDFYSNLPHNFFLYGRVIPTQLHSCGCNSLHDLIFPYK